MAGMGKRELLTSQKENEENGVIVTEQMYSERDNTMTIFSWRVLNFSKLRHYVLYYQPFKNTNAKCVFKLFKTKGALYVCLRSEMIKNKAAQFCIVDEVDHVSLDTPAKRLIEGLYVGDFRNGLILAGNSKYLKTGMLTVSFSYMEEMQFHHEKIDLQHSDPIADRDKLCIDLKHMYLASLYSDFTIRVGSDSFKVHKFVLATRSKFFENIFSQHKTIQEYTVEASPRVVHQVLLYVYSGELKQLEMACMLEMYDVARELGLHILAEKCLIFIAEHINEDTCGAISTLAEKLDSVDLRNIVNNYRTNQKLKPDIK